MKTLLILLGVAAFGQTAIEWKQEPTEFKGVAFGSNQRFFAANVTIPGANYCPAITPSKTICQGKMKVGAFAMDVNFLFEDGAMATVFGTFRSANFDDVVEVFEEKYGKAHSKKSSTVQNRMGASFEQVQLLWAGPAVLLSINKYGESVDEGLFNMSTVESVKRFTDAERAAKRDALK